MGRFDFLAVRQLLGACDNDYVDIVFDSRGVNEGSLFVATVGTLVDGHHYIESAIERGASVVVCEREPLAVNPNVTYVVVEDSLSALAQLASHYYGDPSRELELVGVTGTNGKTTTATLLHHFFMHRGDLSGLLSTVVNMVGDREVPSTHTTPDPLTINRLLREMVDAGCRYCFMEVSSHGIAQKRIEGLRFAGGVFSNLTHDHLDYHNTFAEYLRVKKSFFDLLPSSAFALTNVDDRNGMVMLQNCSARRLSYGLQRPCDYKCKVIESHLDGTLLEIDGSQVWTRFIGRFNAYNLTAIYAVVCQLGVESVEALSVLSILEPVSGRFQSFRSAGGVLSVVDYAHTPDALENVISTINDLRGSGSLVTVVGCGGDRDKTKRPIMARIAAQGSTRVILTSDNPRSENPRSILDDMLEGLDSALRSRVLVVEDRAEAIRVGAALAQSGDILLVAGKGHETYQEVNGVRSHFDDMEQVRAAFAVETTTL